MIKKLTDGKLRLSVKEDLKSGYYTEDNIENFYHDEMFMEDLYIETIDGCNYIIDRNKGRIYDFPFYNFKEFVDTLLQGKTIGFLPYSKRVSKEIFKKIS